MAGVGLKMIDTGGDREKIPAVPPVIMRGMGLYAGMSETHT